MSKNGNMRGSVNYSYVIDDPICHPITLHDKAMTKIGPSCIVHSTPAFSTRFPVQWSSPAGSGGFRPGFIFEFWAFFVSLSNKVDSGPGPMAIKPAASDH